MALDSYRTIGRSGLRVSPFCLGAMTFGEEGGWGSTVKESEEILSTFLEKGGNFVDTANMYARGRSERIIGDFFAAHRSRRDRVVIATKFSVNMYAHDPNGGGCNAKTIIESCEQSLRRLRTDYIDLYWQHAWDPLTPIEETLRALDNLVSSGKVRYVGFSDTPAWKVAEAQTIAHFRGWAALAAIQIEYSLLQRTVEDELIPMAIDLGLGVIPWAPLGAGLLSGKYRRDPASSQGGRSDARVASLGDREYDLIDALVEIAEAHKTTPAAIALAWVRARSGVVAPIIGVRRLEQLEANLAALDVELTAGEAEELTRLSKPPTTFNELVRSVTANAHQGGTTINGTHSSVNSATPGPSDEVY